MIKFNKLFALLEYRGMSAKDICDSCGIRNETLSLVKNGKSKLNSTNINKICELLRCQPGDIMEWVPDDGSENTIESLRTEISALQRKIDELENRLRL